MSIIEIIVVLMMSWWLVFFLALPFGNKWDEPEKGMAASSPAKAHLGLKAIISTIGAILITLLTYYVLTSK